MAALWRESLQGREKKYICRCGVHVRKPARCVFNDGVNLLHHKLKADLIVKHIDVEMCVLKRSVLADLEAVRD